MTTPVRTNTIQDTYRSNQSKDAVAWCTLHRFTALILGMLVGHVIYICVSAFRWSDCPVPTVFNMTVDKGKPRVLCYINTFPAQYERKAIHVYHTWARHCTKTWFTSTKAHPYLPVMMLNLTAPETRMHLWSKMRTVLRRLYTELDQFDFFYKADDDTYAVIENLRAAIRNDSPDTAFMTGYRWKVLCPGGYFSGGSGYILSRQALKQIVEQAIDKHPDCPTYDEDKEDVKMCLCGRAVGVQLLDKLAPNGHSLFYPYSLVQFFQNPHRSSLSQLSDHHLSFHYVEPKWMYTMEFLIYILSPGTFPYINTVPNKTSSMNGTMAETTLSL